MRCKTDIFDLEWLKNKLLLPYFNTLYSYLKYYETSVVSGTNKEKFSR